MGVMDKFLNYMKLNEDEDGEYDDYYDDEDEETEPAPRKSSVSRASSRAEEEDAEPEPVRRPARSTGGSGSSSSKVTPIRQTGRKQVTPSGMEVCVIKPSSFEDAQEITETLLNNRTVVLNLEGIVEAIGQRILDFTSGSCYAINGNMQRISNYIFIITPATVDVSGDFQDIFENFDSTIFNG